MTKPPDETAPKPSARLLLGLAVALSAVPLVVLARTEGLGYDGFWHVFIARVDDWRALWYEVEWTAHPPLFFVCLKAAVATFGTGPLAYRLVSVAGTIAATWLVGRIVLETTGRRWLPAAAAVAFGTSLTVVSITLDVRSYALAAALMLWAYLALLELAQEGLGAPRHRARAVFAVAASLALATHYGTGLFLLSCLPALAVLAALDREFRGRLMAAGRRHWRANLLTFGVPLAALVTAYAVHAKTWASRPFHHLPQFLFDPEREDVFEFLRRNTAALFELYAPPLSRRPFASMRTVTGAEPPDTAIALLASLALVAAVVWLSVRPGRGGGAAIARRVPPILLATMTALTAALALLGRYPYGGGLRHQYFLFPLALIVVALAIDEVARGSNRWIGGLAIGLFALAGPLNAANWLGHLRPTTFNPYPREVARFYRAVPEPEAVFVDQFNLILLFRYHHDWRWSFVRQARGHGPIEIWRVERDGGGGDGGPRGFYVCRDRRQWLLDLSRPVTFHRMARCLDVTGAGRVAVFRPQQWEQPASWPVERTAELAAEAAGPAGLVPETVAVQGQDVFATFTRR